jgi:hypothetical protein
MNLYLSEFYEPLLIRILWTSRYPNFVNLYLSEFYEPLLIRILLCLHAYPVTAPFLFPLNDTMTDGLWQRCIASKDFTTIGESQPARQTDRQRDSRTTFSCLRVFTLNGIMQWSSETLRFFERHRKIRKGKKHNQDRPISKGRERGLTENINVYFFIRRHNIL